jgi:hypothetical protein
MDMHASAPLLSVDVADFIQSGLSITVAARGERLVPSIARAVACKVDAARRQVTVLLFSDAAGPLLRDIASNGRVAVCFSKPSTDRTLQLKGMDAITVPAGPQDLALAREGLDRFALEIGCLGWAPEIADALCWRAPANLLGIRFTPESAFDQTPGPDAGKAIAGAVAR